MVFKTAIDSKYIIYWRNHTIKALVLFCINYSATQLNHRSITNELIYGQVRVCILLRIIVLEWSANTCIGTSDWKDMYNSSIGTANTCIGTSDWKEPNPTSYNSVRSHLNVNVARPVIENFVTGEKRITLIHTEKMRTRRWRFKISY